MTRTIAAELEAQQQSGGSTLAWALKVTRADGEVYGWTSHDSNAEIDGVTYDSAPGLDVASLVSTAGLAVDTTELNIVADEGVITKPEILAGRWDGAAFELFRYNWAATEDGRDVRKVGEFGNVRPKRGQYVTELRSLRQHIQGSVGNVSQPTCRNRLGDAKCGVDLEDFTVTGTLTSVTGAGVMRDSARSEDVHWFANGSITFTSGDNAGLSAKVKAYAADGTITLALPLISLPTIGTTYEMVAGCRKRLAEDCVAKFDNALNFNGEPHLPGSDAATAPPS